MALRPPAPAAALVLAVAASLLTGCAADPPTVSPSGVDLLEIPTPTPDPDDFVDTVDNPWLPLLPGAEWVYETSDGRRITVSVAAGHRDVAGVTTTEVHEVVRDRDGDLEQEHVDWFAQDEAGNVWHLAGESTTYDARARSTGETAWEAGVDGAQAGIAMLAQPRRGDGYHEELAPGVAEGRATVVSLDGEAQVAVGSFEGLLVIDHTSPLVPGVVERRYHQRGRGLLLAETVAGGTGGREMVGFTAGSAAR